MMTLTRPKCKGRSAADPIINAARRRYLRARQSARPGTQPHNILGLFSPVELLTLSLAKRWPLSAADTAFIVGQRRSPEPYVVVAARVAVEVPPS